MNQVSEFAKECPAFLLSPYPLLQFVKEGRLTHQTTEYVGTAPPVDDKAGRFFNLRAEQWAAWREVRSGSPFQREKPALWDLHHF